MTKNEICQNILFLFEIESFVSIATGHWTLDMSKQKLLCTLIFLIINFCIQISCSTFQSQRNHHVKLNTTPPHTNNADKKKKT